MSGNGRGYQYSFMFNAIWNGMGLRRQRKGGLGI
jgi:hypothetical protein